MNDLVFLLVILMGALGFMYRWKKKKQEMDTEVRDVI